MPKAAAISPRKIPGKAKPWQLDIPATTSETGKRERLHFKTKNEATAHAALIEKRKQEFGAKMVLLGPNVRRQAVKAVDLLRPFDISLLKAVEEYVGVRALAEEAGGDIKNAVAHYANWKAQVDKSLSLERLFDKFIQAKEKAGRSDCYLNQISVVKRRFAPLFGETSVSEITVGMLDEELPKLALGNASHNASIRVLNAVFNYAVKKEYAAENPVQKVDKVEEARREVKILTNAQAVELVKASAFDLRPYFLFGLFAGLRPTEVRRLNWESVDLKKGELFVHPSHKQKETNGRFVPIRENLSRWLEPYVGSTGKVTPSKNFRKRFEETRRAADKLLAAQEKQTRIAKSASQATLSTDWDPDCMRHTAASNWASIHANIPEICLWFGHTEKVHRKHYHRPIPKSSAEQFWSILPDAQDDGKVIAIASA